MNKAVDRAGVFGERDGAVERIAPGFFQPSCEAEHLARYRWASHRVKGDVVLDVACGTGYGASLLRAAGARSIVSLDVWAEALRFGFSRYALVAVCGDAERLPLGTETCDTVVSLETIEHLADPRAFVHEVRRVLRTGGEVLLSTPNATRSSGSNPYHVNEMTLDQLCGLFEESGFRQAGVWGQHWGLPPGVWHRIKGVRRILFEVERLATVTVRMRVGLTPLYWCLRLVKI